VLKAHSQTTQGWGEGHKGGAVARHRRPACGVESRLPGSRREPSVSTPHITRTKVGSQKRVRPRRKCSRVFCSSESLESFRPLSAVFGSTVRGGWFQVISQRVDVFNDNLSPTWAMNKYILRPTLVSHVRIRDRTRSARTLSSGSRLPSPAHGRRRST